MPSPFLPPAGLAPCGIQAFRRNSSGSLAKLTASRRASSRGEQLRRRAPTGLVLEVEIAERLSILVAYDEAGGVVLLDGPRRWEGRAEGMLRRARLCEDRTAETAISDKRK